MSARFFKIFLTVLLVHVAVMSVVWVGFPVPSGRPMPSFVYLGPTVAMEKTTDRPSLSPQSNTQTIRVDSVGTDPWFELRAVNKPEKL